MKVTKLVHSCLLVEMPEPVNRTALFDPGSMSLGALDVDQLEFLDDIIITHEHEDHFHMPLIAELVKKFPSVRISTTETAASKLHQEGIEASAEPVGGIEFFTAPHTLLEPFGVTPLNVGVHYLDLLTDPGDSWQFSETKPVLALPITAPWGATVDAVRLALELKPQYILPIHDWHWNDDARRTMYDRLEKFFAENDIKFIPLKSGEPVVLDVSS
jgi:L-ascorbate metabolism protein UlaG (beta-lactamase superfamily)